MNFKSKTEPQSYEVQGKTVRCYHCQNSFFWVRKAQLNSTTFLNFWVDQSATSLICSECGYIHWFLAK